MRTKSLILLIISIGCGLIASFAVSQVMMEKQDGQATPTSGVVVTAKDVSPMTKLTAELLKVEQWPVDRIPFGSITEIKEIEGKFAKQRLYKGEPVIDAKLSARGKDLVVPPGYRIFDVKVDDASGGSGYISPGDRVDVTGFFEKGARFPVSRSIRVIKNVEVAMVDGVSFRDPEATPKRAGTIQLLVLEKQYEVLDMASNLGRLKLSLRAPEEDGSAPSPDASVDAGESFVKWLKDAEKTSSSSQAVANTTANSLSLLQGMFSAMKPKKQSEERKEMTIITPNAISVYRWIKGRKMPIALSAQEYFDSQNAEGNYSAEGAAEYTSPNDAAPTPAAEPAANPAPPAGEVTEPNAVWDPTTGTWKSGGFTPVYP